MRVNNIMDEDYGTEIPDNKQPEEVSVAAAAIGLVAIACILSVVVVLTIRLDRWLLH